MLMGILHGRPL